MMFVELQGAPGPVLVNTDIICAVVPDDPEDGQAMSLVLFSLGSEWENLLTIKMSYEQVKNILMSTNEIHQQEQI